MLNLLLSENPGGRGGGGESAHERGGDARHLASGCKFRKLVSLRVFWAYLAVKVSFRVARKKL